jgi:hypothetical protein
MVIADKQYKISDFTTTTPSIDSSYYHLITPNMYDMWNALKLVTNMTVKDSITFYNLSNLFMFDTNIYWPDWCDFSYLFDTYLGNEPLLNFPKF